MHILLINFDKKLMRNTKAVLAWTICGLGALFYCYEYLLRILPGIIAPHLMQAFNIDATAFAELAAVYFISYVPMQLPVGILVDYYGPRKLLIMASLTCAVGLLLFICKFLVVAQIGRCLIGFGSAFAFVSAVKLITLWLPPARFAFAVGLIMSVSMLGIASASFVLSGLLNLLGWPAVVYFLVSMGVLIALLIKIIIPKKRDDNQPSSIELMSSFKQLLCEALALVKNPSIWVIGLIGCLLYLPISLFAELWAVPYLTHVYAISNSQATGINAMIFIGLGLGSPIIGLLSDYIKSRLLPIVVCTLLVILIMSILLFHQYTGSKLSHLYVLFFLLGLFTSGQTLVFAFSRDLVPIKIAGTTIALINTMVTMGNMIFQPLVGYILDTVSKSKVQGQLSTYAAQDFYSIIFILLAGMVVSLLLSFVLVRPRRLTPT